jgi:hypothetical protein
MDVWSIVYVMCGCTFAFVLYAVGVAILRFTEWLRR